MADFDSGAEECQSEVNVPNWQARRAQTTSKAKSMQEPEGECN